MRDSETSPRQVAAIPVRTSDSRAKVCIIRRKSSRKWGIPKGFIDPGHSREQAALTEAYEEAGLSGEIIGKSIGTYDYKKGSVTLTVAVFLMQVSEEHPTWPEMDFRERRWCSLTEARSLLKNHKVRPLLERIRSRS
jgi:8-oxo-dGTP pyrophosphatase MutT (NUDIX family)